jgi:hypothetical protein
MKKNAENAIRGIDDCGSRSSVPDRGFVNNIFSAKVIFRKRNFPQVVLPQVGFLAL